ncbi:hypothetical protein AVEN_197220-1 [Araneus ventricosus]|uniref:Helitron helicase-like domain-containing protein n=1 Tax=Araneus ventricosus TaxID=182803 RepID=A0A4Y2GJL4_ARAVE|nr:hypothetical protein AVEN_197220-1 [Araneus ventricosus]
MYPRRRMLTVFGDSQEAFLAHFQKRDETVSATSYTFTCNPTWVDILNVLEGPQRPEDRPDVVVRVFKMKLTELLDDITKRNLFGRVISYIYAIEIQKRGLPHAHILLTLDTYSKIRTKDDIDKYVSVELPDPIADPTLF